MTTRSQLRPSGRVAALSLVLLLVTAAVVISVSTASGGQSADISPSARTVARVAARSSVVTAGNLFDRPTASALENVECDDPTNPVVCVHWTTGTAKSRDDAATQEWADTVLATVMHVRGVYQAAGFRMPESDGTAGGNSATDIYLEDVGYYGYYGFCAQDTPASGRPRGADDTPAYCVLDNNFSTDKFGSRSTPEEALDVTVAHEFFHAVQFAYDADEDAWFMEATAVWAEDELYTDVNDNAQYLKFGPLGHPGWSLDDDFDSVARPTNAQSAHVYGDWVFFRWLTEKFPDTGDGPLPTLILQLWQAADSSKGAAKDHYSLQAINTVLVRHGTTLRKEYALFAAANLRSRKAYSEGTSVDYPVAAPTRYATLSKAKPAVKGTFTIDHLASATERITPKALGASAKLRVTLAMAPIARGSSAVLTLTAKNGSVTTRWLGLGTRGKGGVTVPFSSATVAHADLTLVNASMRMADCGALDDFSCGGTPRDQHVPEKFTATLVK